MNNSYDRSNNVLTEGPLVTVGIPTYNRSVGLHRTLECITGQTYKNLEIVVADNCSDGPATESVVREFMVKDPRIRYFRQEIHLGPYFNFNFVLEKSTGEYFMWAADDDEWESPFIYCLLNFLMHNPDVSVAMSGVTRVYENGHNKDITRFLELSTPNYNPFRLACFAASHDVITFYMYGLYRTTTLKKFSKNLDNSFGKDMGVICELLLSTKLGYVDELLHTQHIHLTGTSERYFKEEIGKKYRDPLNYLKFFFGFGPYLLRSSNIPLKRKFWIPFMILRQGIWIGKIYAIRIFGILLAVAKKNSVLNNLIAKVANRLKHKGRYT